MVAITRNKKKVLNDKISFQEKDRFIKEVLNIFFELKASSSMRERVEKFYKILCFVLEPENKPVFDCSHFSKFKEDLFIKASQYNRWIPKEYDRKLLFAPFV